MKDIHAMLRRIDEEITHNRQQIAALQVANARLEDTRRVVMGLEEADQAARQAGEHDRHAAIAGANARPVLIVRKTTGNGKDGRRHKRVNPPDGDKAVRPKILALLAKESAPLTSREIGDRIGLPPDQWSRKGMSNALYQLHRAGVVARSDEANVRDRRYRLAVQQ